MMNGRVLWAILTRNFVNYFSTPTGYLFICVFVLLTSLAAFWPNDFFNSNLANLDQLNQYLPYIMLVFVPAITMSVWAEERRQGTDELLLTLPASDVDVVLGKYLSTVAIFTASLLFSMLANLWVLVQLASPGFPDMGLLVSTYIGYWFVGLAMLSVGMVASFLTGNLTVGFILGALFNTPLAFAQDAELILSPQWANAVSHWSVAEQVQDFDRGVLSLSSVSYFLLLVVVMLYLSMVLIGRRHWHAGRERQSMVGHYVIRTLSLLLLVVGVNFFFTEHDWFRWDITSEKLSSLSPDTKKLIRDLNPETPILIEAYVSPQVPAEYVPTRLNLLSTLKELESLGSGKIEVVEHSVENFSEEAALAEQKYGIRPQPVLSKNRGARILADIYLAVAVTCGLDKVVIPFVDKGIPVEYELTRSICTVVLPDRKTIGVVTTDVRLFGAFSMQAMSTTEDALLVKELRKQYDVVQVDPSQPIKKRYDAILAVQPSSLNPQQMEHLIDAIKKGQPTAIFEDPFPVPNFFPMVVGTAQPKRAPMMSPFGGGRQPPQPKGNIEELWDLLGVRMTGDQIVWQDYNPYPKGRQYLSPEWVFIDPATGAEEAFNSRSKISADLQQVLFIYPGSWRKRDDSQLTFTPLATTGDVTGTIAYSDVMANSGPSANMTLARYEVPTRVPYVIAAHIQGTVSGEGELFSEGTGEEGGVSHEHRNGTEAEEDDTAHADEFGEDVEGTEPGEAEINVVLVADIDCLASAFFHVRAQGEAEDAEIVWEFDNVPFVLNALDVLADDDRFVEIRKRRRAHRTLMRVEQRTEAARTEASERRQEFVQDFKKTKQEEQKKFESRIQKIEQNNSIDSRQKAIRVQIARNDGQRKLDVRLAALENERDDSIKKIERDLTLQIQRVQDRYKLYAVLLPPIPPLLVAFFVFFHRRQMEREGVAKTRLR